METGWSWDQYTILAMGQMVAMASNTGAVYIFKRAGTTWALEQEIADQATGFTSLEGGDSFGYSVALDGGRLVVGAPEDDGGSGYNSGASYIFKKTGTTWSLNQEISRNLALVDSSWANFKTSNKDQPNCKTATDYGSALSSNNAITVSSADQDRWACFKVKNTRGVYSYIKHEIDLSPTITITQNNSQNSVNASASVVTGITLETSSWESFKTVDTEEPDCKTATSYGTASSSANTISSIGSNDNNKWVCFKVKNSNNDYGYAKHRIDLSEPDIIVSQNGDDLTAVSLSTDLPDSPVWKKSSAQDSTPTCSSLADNQWSSGNTVATATHGKHYCFSVVDKQGNTGYGKIKVNLAPAIVIEQYKSGSSALVGATASPITGTVDQSSWENLKTNSTTEPNCKTATGYTDASSSANIISSITSSNDNNEWVCFKVKSSHNIYGYAKYKIDFNAPVVTVVQNNRTLTASTTATDLDFYAYWKYSLGQTSNPTCSSLADNQWRSWELPMGF